MKVSLICEMQGRMDGVLPDAEATFAETLQQAELADKLGFHTFWMTEHHFTPGFALTSQPAMMLSAIAARTQRIRLGFGVVVLPYHHPVHVAERVAYLDIISGGRVEFGTGRGGVFEQLGQGVDPKESRGRWRESVECIRKIWETYPDDFEWNGEYWQVPPRVVIPQPVHQIPSMWVACIQDDSMTMAGEDGMGILAFIPNPPSSTKPKLDRYRNQIAKLRAEGRVVNENWASFAFGACDRDGASARKLADTAIRGFFAPGRPYAAAAAQVAQSLADSWGDNIPEDLRVHIDRYRSTGEAAAGEPTIVNTTGTGLGTAAALGEYGGTESIWNRVDPDTLANMGVTIAGDPQQCIAGLRLWEEIGVDEVMILAQCEGVTHEQSMETIRLIGEEVIPAFS